MNLAGELLASSGPNRGPERSRPLKQKFCEMPFTGVGVRDVLRYLETRTVNDPFTYIVTPNVDHVVRNWRDRGELVEIYEDAELSLCDSRIVSLIGRLSGVSLPVVTGSDLTAIMLEYTIDPQERITIIGGSEELIAKIERRYGLRDVCHFNPPMGFIRDPAAVLEAAQFVERHPSRFVFLAVGSPQQEILAHRIKQRGQAVGIGLCVGASLLFLAGELQRAPLWMQRARLEWLHRLLQEPKRMWRRYLYDAPKILRIAADHRREQRVLVSVVVLTRHHQEFLPRLIERCDAQSGFNAGAIELLVVDCSADGLARSIVERAAGESRTILRFLHLRDIGAAKARALAVDQAAGEFVAFLDDHALPGPAWLETMLRITRIYDPDVVLGPVEAVPDEAGQRDAQKLDTGVYRRFFSYRNDAATGTSFEPRRPLQFKSGGSYVPFEIRNAMMLKANFRQIPSTATGADGEDELFFKRMLRQGRRLVWCAEARVEEHLPRALLTPGQLCRRTFRRAQLTAGVALGPPVVWVDVWAWLVVGLGQVLVGCVKTLFWPLSRSRGVAGMRLVAAGAGKLAMLGGRDPYRGDSVVIEPATPAPPPEPPPLPPDPTIVLEPLRAATDDGRARAAGRRRWWHRRASAA